jgi:ribosomal protein S18 acetylase RimI-like enzyme
MDEPSFKVFTPSDPLTVKQADQVSSFLHVHLQQYGDPKDHIQKAIDYAMGHEGKPGGYVLTASLRNEIKGAVVVNKTGMSGYIPENILVYIAVHEDMRGRGVGKKLMQMALKMANGDVALHVEPDNPALGLYEHLGFKNKYLEMRFTR